MQRNPNTGKRVMATLIDYTIIYVASFWYILTFGEPNAEGGKTIEGVAALAPMVFWFVYLIIVERYAGATLGHRLAGIKVVSADGGQLGLGQVVKRRLCDVIEISWCFGLIAFLIAKNSPQHQRLGDIMAKTIVIGDKEDVGMPQFDFEKNASNG